MPVPSNVDELLQLISQQIIDNNSGLIEEHTLRNVLNQIVNILDLKISLLSPNLTSDQLEIWKKLADFKPSDSLGIITTSTVFPSAKCWGFAAPGTYPNAGDIVIDPNNIGVITYNGVDDFSKIQIPFTTLTLADLSQPYFLSNSSISGNSAHDVEFQAVGGQRYYFNNTFFTVDKFVTTAKMYSVGAGSITFALGLLDQNNKFIERKALTFTTVAGMNTYNFNELLKANERIAVKCPITNGMSWLNNPSNNGVMWETSSYQASATPTFSNTIALELNISDYEENPFVFRTEFEDLKSDVEILKNKPVTVIGDNGNPYFIKVNSNGDLYAKSAVYQKIAHLGHSFTIHEITSFWWGIYGMAASKRENDYVHRFWDKYKAINPSVTNAAYSVKAWEQMENTSSYNFSQINTTIANADVIFIKVGENISYPSMATFESNLNGLVDYIRGQRPTADIVLIGQIWQNATKETVLMSVATNKNLIYISMSGVDTPANRASVNDYVLGDDNVLHQISEGGAIAQGVADHLGDAGHEIVATKLMQALGL